MALRSANIVARTAARTSVVPRSPASVKGFSSLPAGYGGEAGGFLGTGMTFRELAWKGVKVGAAGVVVGSIILQPIFGNKKDFYDYRFITNKDPDDLAGFYGSEDFMELFCVMPFMGTLMMRGGYFDDEGVVHTTGLPGEMLVSMVFSDEDDEETGETLWFNKREQFKDICFGFVCWDMVQNFGFHTLDDGRVEVYHSGEYFHGNFPPFSLIVRLVFQIHARWLIFATEHHINNYAFTSTTEEEEEIEHRSRSDMPYHLLVDILIPKILTTLGIRRRQPALASDEDEADEIEDLTEEEQVEVKAMIKEKISNNVAKDMAQDKAEIARRVSVDKEYLKSLTTDELIAELSRRKSAPLGRKLTRSPSNGGGAAWEMLKSTNDPAAYMTATAHALQRHQTLRQSEGKKDKLMTRLSQTGTLKRHLTFRAENLPEMKPKIEGLSKIVDPPKPAEVKP